MLCRLLRAWVACARAFAAARAESLVVGFHRVFIGALTPALRPLTGLLCMLGCAILATPAHAQSENDYVPIPSFYQEPGQHPNRDYVNQHFHERIDPFTGKLQLHYVDLVVPGNGGLDIQVTRSYTSLDEKLAEPTPYGQGWTMHFGRILRDADVALCDFNQGPTLNPVLELPDGSRQILYVGFDQVSFISASRWKAVCGPGGGLIVFSPDGTQYEMTVQGMTIGSPGASQQVWYPARIVDRNGNTLTFTYEDYPLFKAVKTVTGSDGRLVEFNYTVAASGSGLLTSVVSGTRTWTYQYIPIPNFLGHGYYLEEVHRPDGTLWKYEYNAAFPIDTPGRASVRKVTYPSGGTIEYSYGFVYFSANHVLPRSSVVTQKLADGATWTYTYRPATVAYDPQAPFDVQMLDETTVQAPNGNTAYLHFGYNSARSGYVWAIGLLMAKNTGALENEAYGWAFQTISNQTNLRPGGNLVFDAVASAPVLAVREINRDGQTYTTTYSDFDVYGNPGQAAEAGTDSRTTTLTYFIDPVRWIIRTRKDETTDTIGTITRTFDANANLLTEDRYGVTTTFTYHPNGDLATRTDARGSIVSYSDYKRGIPQSESQPESVSITRVVSDDGNVTSETDGEKATTTYQYDGLNRITGITHPLGNPVTVAWTATTRTISRGNYRLVTTYDGFGREINAAHTDLTRTETITQTSQYNALSQRVFVSYPNATVGTRFEYDMLGRSIAIKHVYDPAAGTSESQRAYNYVANTAQVQNERGYITTYTYRGYGDPASRDLMAITAPVANTSVSIARNGLGQITAVTQDGLTRNFTYDSRFFLVSRSEIETGTTAYGRDALGNMTSRQVTAPTASAVTTFAYDGRNRLSAITYPAGTSSVTRTYFKDDKLKSIENADVRRDYVYDANKRLTQETLTVGPQSFVVQYAYNDNDALNVLTYGSGKTVTYSPDAFGRPTQAAPYVTAVSHHPSGQVSSITYANGVQTTVALNARRWPSSLSITKAAAIFSTTYGYDGVGNLTSVSDTVDSSYNRTLGYDGVDRLTTAIGSWGFGGFSYDGLGNITQQVGGSFLNLTYTYTANRLRSISGVGTTLRIFGYDVYGNVQENGLGGLFAYDDALNMKCANCGLPHQSAYAYDGAGTRVSMQYTGGTTYFVYGSGGNLLWEKLPSGTIKEYIYLDGKQVAVRQQQ